MYPWIRIRTTKMSRIRKDRNTLFCWRAGRGAYGVVEKMKHKQTGTILAVKRITATVNSVEQRRLLMDLDISMRSSGRFVCVLNRVSDPDPYRIRIQSGQWIRI